MSTFYSTIATEYDHIFPLQPAMAVFVQSRFETCDSVLEIGAATGNLSLALTRTGRTVLGIDTDKTMVRIAQARADRDGQNAKFAVTDMRDLPDKTEGGLFDGIVSVGNTLVHLTDLDEIRSTIEGIHHVLAPEGKVVFQTINYDRILNQRVEGLPAIDNEVIRFERTYQLNRPDGRIDFHTTLTVKRTGEALQNRVLLFPLKFKDLYAALEDVGFQRITAYGSFKSAPFNEETSIPLIVTCEAT